MSASREPHTETRLVVQVGLMVVREWGEGGGGCELGEEWYKWGLGQLEGTCSRDGH